MRIIAGIAKGHPIYAPKGLDTRPTTDRVREAIFNILQAVVYNTDVLDLFAGSGALGIEALSRGAKHADFVDHSAFAIKSVKRNLISTKLDKLASVYHQDSIQFLKKTPKRYDLIFLDPPYNTDLGLQALALLPDKLNLDGIIVVEGPKQIEMPDKLDKLFLSRKTNYGDTAVWFYKNA